MSCQCSCLQAEQRLVPICSFPGLISHIFYERIFCEGVERGKREGMEGGVHIMIHQFLRSTSVDRYSRMQQLYNEAYTASGKILALSDSAADSSVSMQIRSGAFESITYSPILGIVTFDYSHR